MGANERASGYQHLHGIIVRENGAKRWTLRRAPAGVAFLQYVACGSASFCMADGTPQRGTRTVVITSRDGGARWVRDEPSAGVQRYLVDGPISCVDSECWIAGNSHRLVFTDDGGRNFSTQTLPAAVCPGCDQTGVANVTFLNASEGYATGGAYSGGLAPTSGEGIVWKTTDGGGHWTMQAVGLNSVLAISCVDSSHCWAASTSGRKYVSTTGAIYGTADGGGHWSAQALPRFHGFLNDLRCEARAGVDRCIAVGENLGETAPVIVSTADGGSLWSLDREPKGVGPLSQAAFVGTTGRAAGYEENARAPGVVLAT